MGRSIFRAQSASQIHRSKTPTYNTGVLIDRCVYCDGRLARPGSEYCCEAHAYYDREGRP